MCATWIGTEPEPCLFKTNEIEIVFLASNTDGFLFKRYLITMYTTTDLSFLNEWNPRNVSLSTRQLNYVSVSTDSETHCRILPMKHIKYHCRIWSYLSCKCIYKTASIKLRTKNKSKLNYDLIIDVKNIYFAIFVDYFHGNLFKLFVKF